MNSKTAKHSAFTLVEALIAMAIVAIAVIALYAGISSGFFTMQLARENMRATQVLTERMEVIRLCSWTQITNGFVRPTFTARYTPAGGPVYSGTVTISSAPLSTAYGKDVRLVDVQLNWTTRGLRRTRSVSTYVSKYGVHEYLLN